MTTQSIALIGAKRSGKGSVAASIMKHFGHAKFSFADGVRELVEAIDPVVTTDPTLTANDVTALYGYERAKDGFPLYRQLLQDVGEGVRQVIGEETWIDLALERMSYHYGPVVVDDCRHPNEVDALVDIDFLTLRVVRPGLPDDGDRHITETALAKYEADITLINEGTLQDLDELVAFVLAPFSN